MSIEKLWWASKTEGPAWGRCLHEIGAIGVRSWPPKSIKKRRRERPCRVLRVGVDCPVRTGAVRVGHGGRDPKTWVGAVQTVLDIEINPFFFPPHPLFSLFIKFNLKRWEHFS